MKPDHGLLSRLRGNGFLLRLTVISRFLVTLTVVFQAYFLSSVITLFFPVGAEYRRLFFPLFLFSIFSIVRFSLTWFSGYAAGLSGIAVAQETRKHLSRHLSELGPTFANQERSGEIVNTVTKGTDALEPYFGQYLPALFIAFFSPLVIAVATFYADTLSGVILVVTAPLIPVFMYLIGSRAKVMADRQWHLLSYLSAHFLDTIQGLTTYKILGQSKKQVLTISEMSEEFRKACMKTLRVAFLSSFTLELIATLSIAILAVSVGIRLLYGYVDYQEALFVLIIAPEFYAPLRDLGACFHAGMEGRSSGKRITVILDSEPGQRAQRNDRPQRKPESIEDTVLSFRNVSFSYEDRSAPILDNLSFTIPPGEKIAIIGPSGAGKSTVLDMLLKFIAPDQGAVCLGEHNLNDIDTDYWRSKLSWIPQRPHLFNCSVEENICLGNNVDSERIAEAVKIACLRELTASLNDGLDTVVGERGVRLSGGEIKRIAIARAVVRNTPIVVMDEPTSNIDSLCESEIMNHLNDWCRAKTVITVTHRLNTVRRADRVIHLKHGPPWLI